MENRGPLLTPSMDLDTIEPLKAFQEFKTVAHFWLEERGLNKQDKYHKTVYLLVIKTWVSSISEDNKDQDDPSKVFKNFESSFQTPNMQWSYKEEALTISSRKITVQQPDIRLTNILLK